MCKKKSKKQKITLRSYKRSLRRMMKRIISGEFEPGLVYCRHDEDHIFEELVRYGYIDATATRSKQTSRPEIRLNPGLITLKGWEFLNPPIDWKFIIPTLISILALFSSILLPLLVYHLQSQI